MNSEKRFNQAAIRVESAYRSILDKELVRVSDRQVAVTQRWREVEHKIADTTAFSANLAKHDYSTLKTACLDLEQALGDIASATQAIVQDLQQLDELLPDQDRLLSSRRSHQSHYPNLYALMLKNSSQSESVDAGNTDVTSDIKSVFSDSSSHLVATNLENAQAVPPGGSSEISARERLQGLSLTAMSIRGKLSSDLSNCPSRDSSGSRGSSGPKVSSSRETGSAEQASIEPAKSP